MNISQDSSSPNRMFSFLIPKIRMCLFTGRGFRLPLHVDIVSTVEKLHRRIQGEEKRLMFNFKKCVQTDHTTTKTDIGGRPND